MFYFRLRQIPSHDHNILHDFFDNLFQKYSKEIENIDHHRAWLQAARCSVIILVAYVRSFFLNTYFGFQIQANVQEQIQQQIRNTLRKQKNVMNAATDLSRPKKWSCLSAMKPRIGNTIMTNLTNTRSNQIATVALPTTINTKLTSNAHTGMNPQMIIRTKVKLLEFWMTIGSAISKMVVQSTATANDPKYSIFPNSQTESEKVILFSSGYAYCSVSSSGFIECMLIIFNDSRTRFKLIMRNQMLRKCEGIIPEALLRDLQNEKEQIAQIRKQQQVISLLHQQFQSKTNQIARLEQQVKRYRPYYQSHGKLKASLHEKTITLAHKEKENVLLMKELRDAMKQFQELKGKFEGVDQERRGLIRERHQIDYCNREIQETFREYRAECKEREENLLSQLEASHLHNNDLLARFQALENTVKVQQKLEGQMREEREQRETFERSQALQKSAINQKLMGSKIQKDASPQKQYAQTTQNLTNPIFDQLNQSLRQELFEREQQLHRIRMLNNELSLEFDRSVNKICQFEKELSQYRKENHELKKTLTLFMEKEKYDKQHKRHLEKDSSEEQEEDYEEEDSSDRKF